MSGRERKSTLQGKFWWCRGTEARGTEVKLGRPVMLCEGPFCWEEPPGQGAASPGGWRWAGAGWGEDES